MVYRSYCRALKAFALVYLELHTTLWKERESVCVWVGERERERECVCVGGREREREREREKECVCQIKGAKV